MNVRMLVLVSIVALAGPAGAAPSQAAGPAADDGLVAVRSRHLDEFYLRPNADLSGFRSVMIEPVTVEFRKDWLRDMNETRSVTRRLVPDDARRIADAAAASMGARVADAFRARGFEIVTAPGAGVLRLSPAVADLDVYAPDVPSPGITRSYTRDAGEATLLLEARDAATGALLVRVTDRNTAREIGRINRSTSVSNDLWFDTMFRQWAANCASEIVAIRDRP